MKFWSANKRKKNKINLKQSIQNINNFKKNFIKKGQLIIKSYKIGWIKFWLNIAMSKILINQSRMQHLKKWVLIEILYFLKALSQTMLIVFINQCLFIVLVSIIFWNKYQVKILNLKKLFGRFMRFCLNFVQKVVFKLWSDKFKETRSKKFNLYENKFKKGKESLKIMIKLMRKKTLKYLKNWKF
jgi:hypothetical protein